MLYIVFVYLLFMLYHINWGPNNWQAVLQVRVWMSVGVFEPRDEGFLNYLHSSYLLWLAEKVTPQSSRLLIGCCLDTWGEITVSLTPLVAWPGLLLPLHSLWLIRSSLSQHQHYSQFAWERDDGRTCTAVIISDGRDHHVRGQISGQNVRRWNWRVGWQTSTSSVIAQHLLWRSLGCDHTVPHYGDTTTQ